MNAYSKMSQDEEERSFLAGCQDSLATAKMEQQKWVHIWRALNESFYPFLYAQLYGTTALTQSEPDKISNAKMLDGTPAVALIILAAGFMNGVTSPARKWLNIKRPGAKPYQEDDAGRSQVHSQTRTKLLEILAGSNYYESRSEQVYEGCGLGTSALLCYEDRDTVVTFINCAPGSFYLTTNNANDVVKFSREFRMSAKELLKEFGEDALPKEIAEKAKKNGAVSRTQYLVCHLIEVNDPTPGSLKTNHPYRELFWLAAKFAGAPCFLAKRPLYEWPVAVFRWGCPDNSTYGVPPTLSVRGKAVQLQNLEYKGDQGLDKVVSPPMLVHPSLKNKPKAFQANGITYTNDLSAANGARPAYQVTFPFQEVDMKRSRIVEAIKDGCFNYLFKQISDLDTVRSATEIDARREEQLVVLGPVLHRSYGEDIGVVVKRVYGIARRKKLMPELPTGEGAEIEFSNILSDVQKASDVATLERFMAFAGTVIPTFPEVQPKVNIFDVLKQYAEGLGVRPSVLNPDEQAQASVQQASQMQELLATSEVAKNFAGAGANLSKTDVGGGLNAVQSLLG